MQVQNTTFGNILFFYSHYKPGKSFLNGLFFWQPLYDVEHKHAA